MNVELLAELRASGFMLFPGVPNTTAVSQETDQNYGSFKGAYARNLDRVIEKRVESNKTTSLLAWMVGLIVFGGVDPETNFEHSRKDFQEKHVAAHGTRLVLLRSQKHVEMIRRFTNQ